MAGGPLDVRPHLEYLRAKFGELYWAKVWQEGAQDLAGFMEGVKRFFAGAAARRDAVLFYIV